jgi:hypothetical protein
LLYPSTFVMQADTFICQKYGVVTQLPRNQNNEAMDLQPICALAHLS